LELYQQALITEESAISYSSYRSEIKRGLDTIKSARGERTSDIDGLHLQEEEKDPYGSGML